MTCDRKLRHVARAAITCALAGGLVLQMPSSLMAEDIQQMEENIESLRAQEQQARDAQAAAESEAQAARDAQAHLEGEVAEAQARLEVLYQEAEAAENDLITITNKLRQTEGRITELSGQIDQAQAELAANQEDLASIISDSYKNGAPSLLMVALSSADFDDFVARITYANKVAQHETDVINRVKDLSDQLGLARYEQQQVAEEQSRQRTEQEQRTIEADAAVEAVESYRAQLSEQVRAQIDAAESASREAARQAALANEAAASRAAEEEAKRAAEEELRRAEEEARRQAEAEAAAAAAEAAAAAGGETSSIAYEPADISGFVASAYSIIGSGYSYHGYNWTGDVTTSWFTCSGVVDYALGRPPRASSPETLYAEVGSRLVHDIGALNYGDLVFYATGGRYPGHVGIYIGGGSIIDAIPGGVAIRDVGYLDFIGGGPIL